MIDLFRSSGLVLLLFYAAFNVLNILYFRTSGVVVGYMLAAIAVLYFMQRIVTAGTKGFSVHQSEVIGFGLMFLMFCTVVAQRIFFSTYIGFDGVDTLSNISIIWFISTIWFLIGGAASAFNAKESVSLAMLVAVGVVLAMVFGISEDLTVDYKDISEESGVSGVSHLALEKHVILLLAFAYGMCSKTRIFVFLAGIVALFLMGGRTALFVFVATFVLISLGRNALRNLLLLGVAGLVVFLGARYLVDANIVDVQSVQVREILFLDGVYADSSFNARITLLKDSFADLSDQFLIGNFTLTTERQGYFGGYAHNLLSAWQFYGFFVFLALILALMYCLRSMVFSMRHHARPIDVFGAFMLVYVIISVVVAKSVSWNLLWFVLGLWLLRPPMHVHKYRRKSHRDSGKRGKVGSRAVRHSYR